MSGIFSRTLRFALRLAILFLVIKGAMEVIAYNSESASRLEARSRDVFTFAKKNLKWHLQGLIDFFAQYRFEVSASLALLQLGLSIVVLLNYSRAASFWLILLLLANILIYYKPEEWLSGSTRANRNMELALTTAFVIVGIMLVRGDEHTSAPQGLPGITPKSWGVESKSKPAEKGDAKGEGKTAAGGGKKKGAEEKKGKKKKGK